jgi:hypothetical protein
MFLQNIVLSLNYIKLQSWRSRSLLKFALYLPILMVNTYIKQSEVKRKGTMKGFH